MDPIAHTFTGAALAVAGLRRATPLATAALLIGANAPDVDVVTSFAGDYAALAHRRGWTHGVLAMVVLPIIVAGGLVAWDRWARRRLCPDAPPARAGPLLGLALLAVATHPTLDWLNNYGMRWLMPFDGRWFYGDALFIIDPWVWLALGGTAFLFYSRSRAALAAWASFWLLATLLIFTTPVPALARGIWSAGLLALVALRARTTAAGARPTGVERGARAALAAFALYAGAAAAANLPARAEVRAALAELGVGAVEDVMIGPTPADPFAGAVVAETPTAYYTGRWHWLAAPRFVPNPDPIPKGDGGAIVAAASAAPEARRYLAWSRFPYFEVESTARGHVVRIRDARYEGVGRLEGVVIPLDPSLRPLPPRR